MNEKNALIKMLVEGNKGCVRGYTIRGLVNHTKIPFSKLKEEELKYLPIDYQYNKSVDSDNVFFFVRKNRVVEVTIGNKLIEKANQFRAKGKSFARINDGDFDTIICVERQYRTRKGAKNDYTTNAKEWLELGIGTHLHLSNKCEDKKRRRLYYFKEYYQAMRRQLKIRLEDYKKSKNKNISHEKIVKAYADALSEMSKYIMGNNPQYIKKIPSFCLGILSNQDTDIEKATYFMRNVSETFSEYSKILNELLDNPDSYYYQNRYDEKKMDLIDRLKAFMWGDTSTSLQQKTPKYY